MKLTIGNEYKWKHEPQIFKYIGMKNGWHQFTLDGFLWCEVVDSDLSMMESCQ